MKVKAVNMMLRSKSIQKVFKARELDNITGEKNCAVEGDEKQGWEIPVC